MELRALTNEEISTHLSELKGWELKGKIIEKTFTFKGYYKTIAFVNSIAWLAQKHVHHPDLWVSFGKCKVSLETHDVNGLSFKDFDLAKEIDAL